MRRSFPLAAAAALALLAAAEAAPSWTPPAPNGFLCYAYPPTCASLLAAVGCDGGDPETRTNFGCGRASNALASQTLNVWQDHACSCAGGARPGQFFVRASERVWENLLGSLFTGASVRAQIVPPSAVFDGKASFSSTCRASMAAIGCPAGAVTLIANNSSATQPLTCSCGDAATQYDQSKRTMELLVDAVAPPLVAAVIAGAPAAPGEAWLCAIYNATCEATLEAIGCDRSQESREAEGCPKENFTLEHFSGVCTCKAPFYTDVAGGRLFETFTDARVKSKIASLLVPAKVAGAQLDFAATYLAVCGALLPAMGCPAAKATIAATTPSTVDEFKCSCGAYDASERVSELMIDFLDAPFIAAAAAAWAAAPYVPPSNGVNNGNGNGGSATPADGTSGGLLAVITFLGVALLALALYTHRMRLGRRGVAAGGGRAVGGAEAVRSVYLPAVRSSGSAGVGEVVVPA